MHWSRPIVALSLLLSLVASPCAAAAGAQTAPECRRLPQTVVVDPLLQPIVDRLLERSATFRRQCAILERAGYLRVEVRLVARFPTSATRARATASRYEFGQLRVLIEIGAGGEYPELLAHEFEHVTELVEHVDLGSLARSTPAQASEGADGAYETSRARDAGRAAAAEVTGDADVDPAVTALGRGLARAARSTWRRLGKLEAVAADPRQMHRK